VTSQSIPHDRIELKSVLVATDFTRTSDRALQHGIAIARHYRCALYIVYVVSSPGFTLAGSEAVELAAEVTERDLHGLISRLTASGKLNGIAIHPVVLKGNVEEQMESFVRTHQIDLIVVGTHGRQGIDKLFFGSFAQLISKCSSCPVLTVGPQSTAPWIDRPDDAERPLLLATAFATASARTIPFAISMANDFQRDLCVLHVMPPHHTFLPGKDRGAHDAKQALALAHLKPLTEPGAALKRAATFHVEFCDPADGILRMAARTHAAIIIMGAHRDPLSDLTVRLPWPIANRVTQEAKCPVLTIRH
jgi:nucleotide-binding universal stress UspA family protein